MFRILNKGDRAEVYLTDEVVGDDFWGGVSANRFDAELRAVGSKDIDLLVNSPGGDVFAGMQMFNALKRHSGEVVARVTGIAASIASVIIQAANKVVMEEGALMMIHPAWTITLGDQAEHRSALGALEAVDATILDIYADRASVSRDDLQAKRDATTWLTGHEAVEIGLAHEASGSGGDKAVAASAFKRQVAAWKVAAGQSALVAAGVPVGSDSVPRWKYEALRRQTLLDVLGQTV